MHDLAASFVLGYHGCDSETAEKLLQNEAFVESTNDYDWLGSGVYFWEANPDRALAWAHELTARSKKQGVSAVPAVIGAAIDLGFCLDLISSNGIAAVRHAYNDLRDLSATANISVPRNQVGPDLLARNLDCAVLNYLHKARVRKAQPAFDSVRGVFTEGEPIYPTAGFRQKTHIQICVRNRTMIKGVFRVPPDHFSSEPA